LCLAALQGGYFLRRQFAQFLGGRDGGTVTQLMHKTVALKHARTSTWRQNTQLYHLCARPFYEAISEGDNRNRRLREVTAIKNKIMGLDFVLAHRQYAYLATEQEKVNYFTERLKLDRSRLPTKVYRAPHGDVTTARYFVDKYPLFLAQDAQDDANPSVSFCFVDEGMVSLSRFEHHLAQYRSLLESLRAFHLIYVAANERHLAGARLMFVRFLMRTASESGGPERQDSERLLAYFKARRLYDTQQLATFDRSELIRLRDAREAFSSPENEALYLQWQTFGDAAVGQDRTVKHAAVPPIHGTFSTCLLEHDYDLFGTFLQR
jgi:hypothetical protein